MNTARSDSLKKRYFYKLVSNVVGLGIGIVTAGLIPRGLGPKQYGDFNFLTGIFAQIKGFLDMGGSTCFYNKISRRQNEQGLVSFYFQFITLASCIIVLFVVFIQFTPLQKIVFPDQKLQYIYMAAVFVILNWLGQGVDQMTDAYGLTIYSERARIVQKIIGAILLLALFIYQSLSLRNYFYYLYFNQVLISCLFVWIIYRNRSFLYEHWKLTAGQMKGYLSEFYKYSFPLFIESSIGMVAGICDRWLLQIFGGSVQQGFYGFSFSIGALCFLFTGAMTPLITREYTIAYANNDIKKMAVLFRRYVPMFYSLAAFFSCFVIIQSEKIVYLFGGSDYKTANLTVKIMALYPIHQVYGQLSTAVLLAAGKTKLYRNVGIIASLSGLLLTFFLLAPAHYGGLNAGANGLALKMVIIVAVVVNTFLYYNSKFLNISFWKYIAHQIVSFTCLIAAAVLVAGFVDHILKLQGNIVLNFMVSGFLYTTLVLLIAYCFPLIFGLKNDDFNYAKNFIRQKTRPGKS